MQPYFVPYIGYWQLLNKVDIFIIYDNIKFTKSSWIRRNRILINGKDSLFTLPIKKDSDSLDIKERVLLDSFESDWEKILDRIKMAYRKAPQYEKVFPMIEKCFRYENDNVFSSNINMDHSLAHEERVMASCKALSKKVYINPIGGLQFTIKKNSLTTG